MDDFDKMYKQSLRSHRARSKKILAENERAYDSLNDKSSKYARTIKTLQDLHKRAHEVYKNASNEI